MRPLRKALGEPGTPMRQDILSLDRRPRGPRPRPAQALRTHVPALPLSEAVTHCRSGAMSSRGSVAGGLTFHKYLTGASASHVASGDDVRHILVPLVLVVASWALRPEGRKLKRA